MKEEYEQFQYWLSHMDDALDDFISSLPGEVSIKMDFSPESLSILETWWLAQFDDVYKALEPESKLIVDGVSRYIGETFRRSIGGIWDISYEDPKNVYYGLPVITKYMEPSTPICPMALSTACLDRRTGDFWISLLNKIMSRIN